MVVSWCEFISSLRPYHLQTTCTADLADNGMAASMAVPQPAAASTGGQIYCPVFSQMLILLLEAVCSRWYELCRWEANRQHQQNRVTCCMVDVRPAVKVGQALVTLQ